MPWTKKNFSFGGNVNWSIILESNLVIGTNTSDTCVIYPHDSTLRYVHPEKPFRCAQKANISMPTVVLFAVTKSWKKIQISFARKTDSDRASQWNIVVKMS